MTSTPPAGRRDVVTRTFARCALLAAALFLPACAERPGERPPPDEVARATLVAAFGPDEPDAGLFVAGESRREEFAFRPATDGELAALWRPGPYDAVRIESMNCRFHPVWRVAFRPARRDAPAVADGPVLVAELVPAGAIENETTGAGGWLVLGRWWPSAEGDRGRPDFRPRGRAAPVAGDGRFVTAWPVWAVPPRADAGFAGREDERPAN